MKKEEGLRIVKDLKWKIEGPFYTETPNPKTEYVQNKDFAIKKLNHYLTNTFIVHDNISKFDRGDIEGWRELQTKILDEEYPGFERWINQYSKLGSKNIVAANASIVSILDRIGNENELGSQLIEIVKNKLIWSIKLYESMKFKDKIQYGKKLDTGIYQFLERLTK